MFTFPAPWGSNIDSFGLVKVGYSDLEATQFLNQEDYDADVLIFHTLGSTLYMFANIALQRALSSLACKFTVNPNLLYMIVFGLCGKVLVAGGATEIASVRSCEKLPPYLIKPMTASSKTDPLVAKAEPNSYHSRASVRTKPKQ